MALRDCAMAGEPRNVYRLAKSLELLCETVRMWAEGALVPLAPEGDLSFADTRRLIDARRLIDERWHEKLTLDSIARACGLNRAKLTRGFRELFACSIAEALAERRLGEASRMLLTTDKPVSSIGYENGYLNNASFARAFSRRFGRSPSDFRATGVAA
jgi:AraC family transcriptional activator of pyochelin receptor